MILRSFVLPFNKLLFSDAGEKSTKATDCRHRKTEGMNYDIKCSVKNNFSKNTQSKVTRGKEGEKKSSERLGFSTVLQSLQGIHAIYQTAFKSC